MDTRWCQFGLLPSTTMVHRGATGTGKTQFAKQVVEAGLGAEDAMRLLAVVCFDREGDWVGGTLVVILDESELIAQVFATDLRDGA